MSGIREMSVCSAGVGQLDVRAIIDRRLLTHRMQSQRKTQKPKLSSGGEEAYRRALIMRNLVGLLQTMSHRD